MHPHDITWVFITWAQWPGGRGPVGPPACTPHQGGRAGGRGGTRDANTLIPHLPGKSKICLADSHLPCIYPICLPNPHSLSISPCQTMWIRCYTMVGTTIIVAATPGRYEPNHFLELLSKLYKSHQSYKSHNLYLIMKTKTYKSYPPTPWGSPGVCYRLLSLALLLSSPWVVPWTPLTPPPPPVESPPPPLPLALRRTWGQGSTGSLPFCTQRNTKEGKRSTRHANSVPERTFKAKTNLAWALWMSPKPCKYKCFR